MLRTGISYRLLGSIFLLFWGVLGGFAQFDPGEEQEGAEKVWSLQECIEHAYEENLQVRQQELNVEGSDLDRKQAYYDLLPSVNAFASHGYNWGQRVDQFTNQFVTRRVRSNSFGVNSELVLFQGMQRLRNIQQAEHELEAQKARVEETKNNIALNIANAYLQVLFNKEILQIAEDQRKLTRQQVERMQDMYEAGEVSRGEVLDLESQWESEKVDVTQARNDLELSKLDLVQFLQLEGAEARSFEVQAPPSIDEVPDSMAHETPRTVFEKAKGEMPSIRAAEASIKSAEEELAIAQGGRSPTLSASGSYGTGYSGQRREPVGEPELLGYDTVGVTAPSGEAVLTPRFDQETETVSFWDQVDANLNQNVGLQLNIPIFQRMSTNTQIKKARISLERARLEKESANDQLRQDIQQAYADAIAAMRKYRASRKAVQAREESFSYAEARFEAGAITTVEYSDAKTKLTQARSEMLQAKYEQLFKRKVLRFYLGETLNLEENP